MTTGHTHHPTTPHPTSRPSVAVATYRELPELDGDGPALLAALDQAGLDAEVRVWDDPAVDWDACALVLVRSTWDYTLRREEFLRWARSCRRTANPAHVLAWNSEKHHLTDLAAAGVPVVPTVFREPGQPLDLPEAWRGGDVVVKPTVSAGAADTGRFAADAPGAQELAARLHRQRRTVMVQPYQPGVDEHGETALVHLGGRLSHAVRKAALLTGPGERTPLFGDAVLSAITPATATPAQVTVAEAALAAVPGGPQALSYARVDLVPGPDGQPVVLELELTEPSLFLHHAPAAGLQRMAEHVAAAARTP